MKTDQLQRIFNILIIAGIVVLAGSLLAFGVLGFFTRYIADDYCFGAALKNAPNFFAAQMNWYVSWSGRYSATFLVSLGDLFGPYNTVVWPLAMLTLTVAVAAFFIRQALPSWPRRAAWFSALLSTNYLYIFSPNRYQSFYWRPGLASYTLSIAGLLFLSALILRFARCSPFGLGRVLRPMLIVVLSLALGGLSETTGILLTGALVLATSLALSLLNGPQRRVVLALLLAALAGAVVSLLLIAFAPGTAVRAAQMPRPPAPWAILLLSLRYALAFVYTSLKSYPFPSLGLAGASFLLAFGLKRFGLLPTSSSLQRPWGAMLVVASLAYTLLVCIFLPSLFAEAAYADNRVLVLGAAILVWGIGLCAGLAGLWLAGIASKPNRNALQITALALFLVTLLYPLRSTWSVTRQFPGFIERAAAWDARHAQLVEDARSGVQDAQVTEFSSLFGLQELVLNPHDWANECAAAYYGLQSIQASEP